jgi:hypothetical protein
MRAAQIENGVVINYAEVNEFDSTFIAPGDSVIGSTWDGQQFIAPAPAMPTVAEYTAAVQAHLDAKAQERNYDGILSACTYATSSNPKFKAEGQACVDWRDAVWAQCYATMAAVQQGQQLPPTLAELIDSLPDLVWPSV